jgi:hypothetical protein
MAFSQVAALPHALCSFRVPSPCRLGGTETNLGHALAFDVDWSLGGRVSSSTARVVAKSTRREAPLFCVCGHRLTPSVCAIVDRQETAAVAERTKTHLRKGMQQQTRWRREGEVAENRSCDVFRAPLETADTDGLVGIGVAPVRGVPMRIAGRRKSRAQRYRAGRSLRWVGSQEVRKKC